MITTEKSKVTLLVNIKNPEKTKFNAIDIIKKLIAIDCLIAQKDKYVKNGNKNEEIIMAADLLKVCKRVLME